MGWLTAALGILNKILGFFSSQSDANAAAVQEQDGVDAERSASLAAQVKTLEAEQKAAASAAATTDQTIADLRKGGF
jgi:hypothetical protein